MQPMIDAALCLTLCRAHPPPSQQTLGFKRLIYDKVEGLLTSCGVLVAGRRSVRNCSSTEHERHPYDTGFA